MVRCKLEREEGI